MKKSLRFWSAGVLLLMLETVVLLSVETTVFAQTSGSSSSGMNSSMMSSSISSGMSSSNSSFFTTSSAMSSSSMSAYWMRPTTCSGEPTIRCPSRSEIQCIGGRYQCVTTHGNSSYSGRSSSWMPASSSSVSSESCGANNVRCMDGFSAVCKDRVWRCEADEGASSSDMSTPWWYSSSSMSSVSSSGMSSSGMSSSVWPTLPYCMGMCPDGYMYPVCTEDGHDINYFADPCMMHQGQSSSGANSCGPSTILCRRNTSPVCMDGRWTCKPQAMWEDGDVRITSIVPESTQAGMRVTIRGEGFARRRNIVMFADSIIPNLRSLDGTSLVFRVPRKSTNACYFQKPRCGAPKYNYDDGTYPVSVYVNGSVSNVLSLTLR